MVTQFYTVWYKFHSLTIQRVKKQIMESLKNVCFKAQLHFTSYISNLAPKSHCKNQFIDILKIIGNLVRVAR